MGKRELHCLLETNKMLATENTEGVAPPTYYCSRNTQIPEEKSWNENKVWQHSNTEDTELNLFTLLTLLNSLTYFHLFSPLSLIVVGKGLRCLMDRARSLMVVTRSLMDRAMSLMVIEYVHDGCWIYPLWISNSSIKYRPGSIMDIEFFHYEIYSNTSNFYILNRLFSTPAFKVSGWIIRSTHIWKLIGSGVLFIVTCQSCYQWKYFHVPIYFHLLFNELNVPYRD